MSSMHKPNKANGLMPYRLSLFSFVVFITISLAWFILSAIERRGAGANFGLLYPFLAFLLASAFNLFPLFSLFLPSAPKVIPD